MIQILKDMRECLHLLFYIKIFIVIVCCVSVRKISEISDKMSHEGSNLDWIHPDYINFIQNGL